MQWYLDKLEALSCAPPLLSVCGDDCAVCPRYLAKTEEELHQTALFWHQVGWRDRVVSKDEISCRGCGSRKSCTFMLLPCLEKHGVQRCSACSQYPCENIRRILALSAQKEEICRKACGNDDMFALLKRAFYEKEKNLQL